MKKILTVPSLFGGILIVLFAPISFLDIEMDPNYLTDEQITFSAYQYGCGFTCDFHKFSIINENGTTIKEWASIGEESHFAPNMFYVYKKHFGKDFNYDLTLNEPGIYILEFSTGFYSTDERFEVVDKTLVVGKPKPRS